MHSNYQDDFYHWELLNEELSAQLRNLSDQQLLSIQIAGKKVCISRVQGTLMGILDRCPHAGTPLHMGTCNKKGIVVCPTHHYKFDLKTGLSADGNNYRLPVFKIREVGSRLEVGWRK
jgi:3-phenylpropionate/trans-cinnamate dioxygenase ferredoxin subunit